MAIHEFHLGFERKIGYSFVGLLAGNIVCLAALIVGLPVVMLLLAKVTSRLHWLLALIIGATLGVLALYVEIDRGRLDIFSVKDPIFFWQSIVFASAAALNSAVAFTTYCTLVQWARLTHEIESGAPSGTPRFFSVF
jgi:hypothetical protein